MLSNVVVHINNEQPILVDLVHEPTPSDIALICRNIRAMNGKKPVFVDNVDSTFVIPLAHVRFIEMPRSSIEALESEKAAAVDLARATAAQADCAEAPLARLAWLSKHRGGPVEGVAGEGSMDVSGDAAERDELDDDLLRRIREA
jgi:hypothetical protein